MRDIEGRSRNIQYSWGGLHQHRFHPSSSVLIYSSTGKSECKVNYFFCIFWKLWIRSIILLTMPAISKIELQELDWSGAEFLVLYASMPFFVVRKEVVGFIDNSIEEWYRRRRQIEHQYRGALSLSIDEWEKETRRITIFRFFFFANATERLVN